MEQPGRPSRRAFLALSSAALLTNAPLLRAAYLKQLRVDWSPRPTIVSIQPPAVAAAVPASLKALGTRENPIYVNNYTIHLSDFDWDIPADERSKRYVATGSNAKVRNYPYIMAGTQRSPNVNYGILPPGFIIPEGFIQGS